MTPRRLAEVRLKVAAAVAREVIGNGEKTLANVLLKEALRPVVRYLHNDIANRRRAAEAFAEAAPHMKALSPASGP